MTNGVATLAGPVHSAEESRQIEAVARSVSGVVDVKNALPLITETSVTPGGAAPMPTAGTLGTPRPASL